MGSPEFAVPSLEALHGSQHQLIAVVTQPDRPRGRRLVPHPPAVKVTAQNYNLPVLQPATTKSDPFIQEIRSFHPDILVVVAYGEILRPALLEISPFGAVNLHASLLPKFRGAAPIPWAILHGETHTGVSTMLLNEVMDGGDVLLQETCAIEPADTSETLTRKLAHLGAPLLRETLDRLERNAIQPKPQDPSCVTYAPKLRKEDGEIDWNKTSEWISRQVRAFDPWPGSFSLLRDITVKFWLANTLSETTSAPPGTVVQLTRHSFHVACGEGSLLEILQVQPQNRPRCTAGDFINGYHIRQGDRFMKR